jgi:hypothetical protein
MSFKSATSGDGNKHGLAGCSEGLLARLECLEYGAGSFSWISSLNTQKKRWVVFVFCVPQGQ